jgi:HK97 family phage portal protein
MRWNPFARKAPAPEQKSLATAGSWWELITGTLPTSTGSYVTKADALAVPAVANAIQIIAEATATLDIFVKRIEGTTEVDDDGHPLLPLLRDQVNGWTSSFEFFRQIVVDALTDDAGGMAYVVRASDGRALEIIRYMPGILTFDLDETTGERRYRISNRPVPASDVIHLLPPLGRSPLTLARDAISVAKALNNHGASLFANGARPSGILKIPAMGKDQVEAARDAWNATHGGAQSGKTAVLINGAEFEPLTMTSTDGQFLENRKFQILEIARAFNIPAPMIGDLERATWANSEQKGREFLSYTLEPWLRGLEGALRRALFSDEERGGYVIRFDRDDLTRADLSTRATVINSLISSQTINPNEGRDWLGLPPRAGGDAFLNPNITSAAQPGADTGTANAA